MDLRACVLDACKGGDPAIHTAAKEIVKLLTARDTLQGVNNAEKLANEIGVLCNEMHKEMVAREPTGMTLRDVITMPRVLEAIRGPAGNLLINLQNGQDKDSFGKLIARIAAENFVPDEMHTKPVGHAVGDGGDGMLFLPPRGGGKGGRQVRVEVRTVVPVRPSGAGVDPNRLPDRDGRFAGRGSWRPKIAHTPATDLAYFLIMWHRRTLPKDACTLREAVKRTVGWVVMLDNAETFSGMIPWTGKGPTLNPRNWMSLGDDVPAFGRAAGANGTARTKLMRPPTRVCAWIPGLVAPDMKDDPMAYWEALRGLVDRNVTGGIGKAVVVTSDTPPDTVAAAAAVASAFCTSEVNEEAAARAADAIYTAVMRGKTPAVAANAIDIIASTVETAFASEGAVWGSSDEDESV